MTDIITVNELARRTNLPPGTVRYYTRIGVLQPSGRLRNGYQVFSEKDVARLEFVLRAKHLGFALAEIRAILLDAQQGLSPCPRVRACMKRRVAENACKLRELQALQQRMENALEQWRALPDAVPRGDAICYLIESFKLCLDMSPAHRL